MSHCELGALADHVLGTKPLTSEQLAHLEQCPHCRSDLTWLESLRNLRRFEPPSSAVQTVVDFLRKGRRGAA